MQFASVNLKAERIEGTSCHLVSSDTLNVDFVAAVQTKCHERFEFFTAVTAKNVVFWDIKTQFVPHRRHNTSPLQSPAS
jgi:hypothetical protein